MTGTPQEPLQGSHHATAGATLRQASAVDEHFIVVVWLALADWNRTVIVCVPAAGVVPCPLEV
jgi:hypothetical protein